MKLLIADDHTLFRDALVLYIQRADPKVSISLAGSFPEALDIMKEKSDQDLVILDLRMPGMNGMQGFERMRDNYPKTRVALMSGVAEPEDVRAAMDLGAVGYFPKTLSGKNLLKAIQNVLAGNVFLPVTEQDTIMPSYYGDAIKQSTSGMRQQNASQKIKIFNFTSRERDVIEQLALGKTNKEIADILGLQVVTIKLHVRGICQKLGAQNRTQAAVILKDLI